MTNQLAREIARELVEELPGAKVVRINGQLAQVPELELTDPHPWEAPGDDGWCNATEPDWPGVIGGALCTLPPHDSQMMHIAHNGDGDVIAMWIGRPGILLSQDQLEAWAGSPLTDEDLARLADCIPNSAIPDAISTIATDALHIGQNDEDDESAADDDQGGTNGYPPGTFGAYNLPF